MDDAPNTINGSSQEETKDVSSNTSVADKFEQQTHLYSTRTSDGFEAIDRTSGQHFLLWTLRFPISVNSDEALRFTKRIESITKLSLNIAEVKSFGVDPSGIAYLVTELIKGKPIVSEKRASIENEKIFIKMLKAIEVIHRAGYVLGDIAEDTFRIADDEEPVLLGLMGSFDLGAKRTAMLPSSEKIQFLAPEQKSLSTATAASDVYALGVLAYKLFTSRSLFKDNQGGSTSKDPIGAVPPPSVIRSDLSPWVDDVLGTCLERNPHDRFRDASEVLEVIERSLHTGLPPGGNGRWSKRTLVVKSKRQTELQELKSRGMGHVNSSSNDPYQSDKTKDSSKKSKGRLFLVLGLFSLVGALGAAFVFILSNKTPTNEIVSDENTICEQAQHAPTELKELLVPYCNGSLGLDERKNLLARMAPIQDPIVDSVLLGVMKGESGAELKNSGKEAVISRIAVRGLKRTSKIIGTWIEVTEKQGVEVHTVPVFIFILRAADTSKPLDSRQFALRNAFSENREIALQTTAALALDEPDPERFTPVLRQLIAADLGEGNLGAKNLTALIISHKALDGLFDDDLADSMKDVPEEDLTWSMLQLANYDGIQLSKVAKIVIDNEYLPSYNTIFLQKLLDEKRFSMKRSVQRSLVRASLDQITQKDIAVFARWQSVNLEPVLLAICAVSNDAQISVEAFDILAARTLQSEPAISLVRWVKSLHWDQRDRLAKVVGVLSLPDYASEEDFQKAFNLLLPFSADGTLFRAIHKSKEPRLMIAAIETMGEITRSSELVALLSHENRDVRIATIKALKGRNDLNVLQAIYRAYKTEKDEEVIEIYKNNHWVAERNPTKF